MTHDENTTHNHLTSIPNFFLDNNFFWSLAKDKSGKKIQNWNKDLKAWKICPVPRNIYHITTAFSFLESIKPQKAIPSPSKQQILPDSAISDIEEYKAFIYKKAISHYAAIKWLTATELKKASAHQKTYASPFGKTLYEKVVEHNLKREGFADWLWKALAYDFLMTVESPKHFDPLAWDASFYIDIIRAPTEGLNYPLVKASVRHFRNIFSKIDSKTPRNMEFLSNIKLKSMSDHVDSELISFAVGGYLKQHELQPVICFTEDSNEQRIRDRVFAQRALLEAAHARMLEMDSLEPLPFRPLTPINGHIFTCDQHGNIKSHINVNSINKMD